MKNSEKIERLAKRVDKAETALEAVGSAIGLLVETVGALQERTSKKKPASKKATKKEMTDED